MLGLRLISKKYPKFAEFTLGIALIIGILVAQAFVEMGF
jgi:hypothetical protein